MDKGGGYLEGEEGEGGRILTLNDYGRKREKKKKD